MAIDQGLLGGELCRVGRITHSGGSADHAQDRSHVSHVP